MPSHRRLGGRHVNNDRRSQMMSLPELLDVASQPIDDPQWRHSPGKAVAVGHAPDRWFAGIRGPGADIAVDCPKLPGALFNQRRLKHARFSVERFHRFNQTLLPNLVAPEHDLRNSDQVERLELA